MKTKRSTEAPVFPYVRVQRTDDGANGEARLDVTIQRDESTVEQFALDLDLAAKLRDELTDELDTGDDDAGAAAA